MVRGLSSCSGSLLPDVGPMCRIEGRSRLAGAGVSELAGSSLSVTEAPSLVRAESARPAALCERLRDLPVQQNLGKQLTTINAAPPRGGLRTPEVARRVRLDGR